MDEQSAAYGEMVQNSSELGEMVNHFMVQVKQLKIYERGSDLTNFNAGKRRIWAGSNSPFLGLAQIIVQIHVEIFSMKRIYWYRRGVFGGYILLLS